MSNPRACIENTLFLANPLSWRPAQGSGGRYHAATMAGKTRELRTRIKAVGNIQRITKTMQMIATARFQSLQRRATSAQAYSAKLAEVVGELTAAVGASGDIDHPLLSPPEPKAGKDLLLVLSSNRGLCGGYNANVFRAVMGFLGEHAESGVEIVGRKGLGIAKFNKLDVAVAHDQFTDTPAYEDVNALAERYMAEFVEGQYDGIYVASMRFISMGKQVAEVTRLLPMEPPKADEAAEAAASGGNMIYEFSPDAEQLLAELLPATIKTQLYQLFNEAVVSEQLARMIAMKAATDAAGKTKKTLGRDYNRARQAAITTELTEIIGGVAALS